MRGTLIDQDLSEVSEQECHDTSFCYKSPLVELSDSPSVSKNRTAKITMSLFKIGHMPYCDLALFHYPYEGVSGCLPRPG